MLRQYKLQVFFLSVDVMRKENQRRVVVIKDRGIREENHIISLIKVTLQVIQTREELQRCGFSLKEPGFHGFLLHDKNGPSCIR